MCSGCQQWSTSFLSQPIVFLQINPYLVCTFFNFLITLYKFKHFMYNLVEGSILASSTAKVLVNSVRKVLSWGCHHADH